MNPTSRLLPRQVIAIRHLYSSHGLFSPLSKEPTIATFSSHLRQPPSRPLCATLGSGPELEEILEKTIEGGNAAKKLPESQEEEAQRLTSSRREVLALYRQIWRATRLFVWRDAHGMPWRDVLRVSARKEFEEARFERDPEIIARLLVGGHDAVQAAIDQAVARQQQIVKSRTQPPPGNQN